MSALHPAELLARTAAETRDEVLRGDRARRRAHGVVHTPPEIARCALGVLDELMRARLGVSGVCDAGVQLVEPACGPGALLAAALRLWQLRGRAPGFALRGIDLDADALRAAAELAPHAPADFELLLSDALREPLLLELASDPDRVLAVVANPPWASARADKTPHMQELLEDFRRDAGGMLLPERKLGVLSDTYVRFFRLCAEAARRAPRGAALALISNGSFLDGPVHRGMRAALLRWFDAVYVLDLGGSALVSRAGLGRDDNVFGVRPSVTISWLCRSAGEGERDGELYYARLRGARADKLARLEAASLGELGFERLAPEQPLLRFVPRVAARSSKYARWPSLAEWLPFQREGVQTNRDRLAIDVDRARLLERLRAFARGAELPELGAREQAHFSVKQARRNLAEALERDEAACSRPIAYRPFDVRWFCAVTPLCHRPRPELLRAIEHAPDVLASVRKDRGFNRYAHFAAAAHVIDNCLLSARSSCRARAFPARTPDGEDNLAPELRDRCSAI
ncbi:MAG TPA: type ISP restriction/modification enzyme, partial [Polyangiales bacterium]|nr:type ISP restriction/modification enzyme [Polyangiales bacterium]